MGRWIAYAVLGLIAAALVLAMAAFLLLDRFDLGPLAAARASARLGRRVTIAGLHVTPGRWLTIELHGVQVANIPGGTRPVMADLAHLTAEIQAWSLLHGPANVRRLQIDGLSVLLEHTADDTPNWRRGKRPPRPPGRADRSWFPTLLDARIHASEIILRTVLGPDLTIRVDDGAIRTAGPDAPVKLTATGAYRTTPLSLDADLQSIAVLRNAATPYGTDLRLTSGDDTLRFQGTMTKPLDVDGASGALTLHAPTVAPLLAVAGAASGFQASLELAGTLTRSGRSWQLTGATGTLDDSGLAASSVHLTEGRRGQPDDVQLDLAFSRLNLDPLLAGSGAGAPLTVARVPDPLLAGRLTARQLSYQRRQATDAALSAAITPGRIAVDELAMTAFGARLKASGHAESADQGGGLAAEASISGADVQQLRRGMGGGAVPMLGRLDALFAAASAGRTLAAAARSAQVAAVIWMTSGSISRDVVEKASVDVRRLFRAPKGMTPIACMLAVIEMRAGAGTISPLRIRTPEATIAGQGRFDLYRNQIDVTVGSQSATTSDFALDIPFRISGSLGDPDVRPARGKVALATADLARLPSALRQAAEHNPCITAR